MKSEFELYGQLMAKPKTNEPIEEGQFKNYTSDKGCELYSDWIGIVYTGEKHTRDRWVGIVETALKSKYPEVLDWDALVNELLFIDIDGLGALSREDGLIWW